MTGRAVGLTLVLLSAGCGTATDPNPGNGARQTVLGFFESLIQQEWDRAYGNLHPDSQARWGKTEFARLAQLYRRNLGFEPEAVKIRTCEEHGAEAVAHVVLTGPRGGKEARYKDAVTLKHTDGNWAIVLRANFGKK